ncbi:MAG: dihydropteroate synthase [Anaerolineaceae bacterium]|nr:dihydropteroate synthase [Anaerolineaceae bacterium]
MPDPFLPYGQKTFVMGILNVTPDSFSGDGLMEQKNLLAAALAQATRFIEAGADILDIGGESTRPGSQLVNADEELARVLPVIVALKKEFPQILLSIDTYKAAVAEAALQAGVHWVNDVWGLRADVKMAAVVASGHAPVVLMHNRSKSERVHIQAELGGTYLGADYGDFLADVKAELMQSVALAKAAGVTDEQIILDPGLGFGKSREQNLELVNHLDEIKALGYPVLLGPSRKSFIGYTLNLPPDQRVEGTAAVCAVGIVRGADILRVHDVEAIVRTARMTDALIRPSL